MSAKVQVRKAWQEDREGILAFCKRTFEWGDYIGDVWDKWLHDPAGPLFVALIDDQPAGVGKLTMISKTEAWLEGLRVNPAFRGHGVAQALYDATETEARKRYARVARYATYSGNEAIHHLSLRYGYERVASLIEYVAPGQPGPFPAYLRLDEADDAERLLAAAAGLAATGGLYSGGWHCQELRGGRLRQHIVRGEAYVVRRKGQPAALALIAGRDPKLGLRVGFLVGIYAEFMIALARQLRSLENPSSRVFVIVPAIEASEKAMQEAGYERNWEQDLWIYERKLRGGRY
jgi:GNAT superfamily N-acetyltransferase